mgnify:FL=1
MVHDASDCLTPEEVAYEHRSGFVVFHVALKLLTERFEIPEKIALEMLFPTLKDTGDERLG